MSATKSRKADHIKDQKIDFLCHLQEVWNEIFQDAEIAKTLLKASSTNDTTKFVDDLFQNPLKYSLQVHEMQESVVMSMLNAAVQDFILENKKIIRSAFKITSPNSAMHYVIIFKSNKDSYRYKFNDFVRAYDMTGLGQKFPLIMQYIPKELITNEKKQLRVSNKVL